MPYAMTFPPALAFAFALTAALPLASQAQQVLPAQSEISFVSKQMGVPVAGRFKNFSAQMRFDPRKPEAGSVAFSIDAASASFGAAETDAEVPKAAWFNVAKFPTASFQSSAIKALGGGRYEVRGQLQIKGQAHSTVVPVLLVQNGSTGTASGSFVIQRLDFKIGDGEWADTSMVANEVQVKFKLALAGLAH